jgi:serine/threonine-protein kinase
MLPRRASTPLRLGPYTLIERLAQGGMAAVYKARLDGPNGFEKTVVVKAMLPALAAHDELVGLFGAEARLSAQLNHPNIVQVLDFDVEQGTPYLVMEYLDGWTLAQLRDRLSGSRRGRFPVGAAVKIARDVCLALGYAHNFTDRDGLRRQIIHRDVSPANVMLCRDGSVKLLDFGIARVASPSGSDITTSFRGKYAYMAPEQVRRQPIDRRVDVFAAGIVLHEMLTGKRLFASVSELETLERVAAALVTAPSGENAGVPRTLDAIVKKALARDPAGRYSSGAAMAEALDTLDGQIFSRRSMTELLRQLFPEAWTVVCEVCGKQVLPGRECGECGTPAPIDESIDTDANIQPLPPPPAGRPTSPPHLFVVPKLPMRLDDDSVKMGTTPGFRAPRSLVAPAPPPAPVWVPPPEPLHLVVDTPAPDLRSEGGRGRLALALLAAGVLGMIAALVCTPAPPVPVVVAPAPAPIRISAPIPVRVSTPTVVLATPPPPAHVATRPRVRHHERAATAAVATVKEGRIVDPFSGAD